MTKKIDFTKLFFPSLVFSGAVFVLGLLMLLIFGGKTYAEFTLNNLCWGYLVKTGFSLAFVFILTTLYFVVCYKKKGLWFGIFGVAAASVNAVVSFFLCVVFRANLGELTFAVILLSVLFTYITTLVFSFTVTEGLKEKKKKKTTLLLVEKMCLKSFRTMLLPLVLTIFAIIISFVLALIFGVSDLALYAFPVIFSIVSSVVTTLAYICRFYKS